MKIVIEATVGDDLTDGELEVAEIILVEGALSSNRLVESAVILRERTNGVHRWHESDENTRQDR